MYFALADQYLDQFTALQNLHREFVYQTAHRGSTTTRFTASQAYRIAYLPCSRLSDQFLPPTASQISSPVSTAPAVPFLPDCRSVENPSHTYVSLLFRCLEAILGQQLFDHLSPYLTPFTAFQTASCLTTCQDCV